MNSQDRKNLKQELRRLANLEVRATPLGTSHEQQLRRALLNSRHFSAGPIIQFWRSFELSGLTWRLALGSVTLGFVLAFAAPPLQSRLNNEIVSIPPAPAYTAGVLHQLRASGQMRYAGQDARGASIYTVDMNGQTYEVHDDYARIQKAMSR